jgi:opacity protein-like surface antigen
MNRIYKLSAIALLASSTSLMAQTKSFTGFNASIFGGIVGAEVDGSASTPAGTVGGEATAASSASATIGKVTPIGGIDLGYAFPAGQSLVIGVGATYVPVKAEIGLGKSNDSSSGGTYTAELKDHFTIYLQPTFIINKDSAFFAKVNYANADVKNADSASTTAGIGSGVKSRITSGDVEGFGFGLGLKTFLTPTMFVQVEANYTDYDKITATRTGSDGRVTTYSGDPALAQGLISLGMHF